MSADIKRLLVDSFSVFLAENIVEMDNGDSNPFWFKLYFCHKFWLPILVL